MVGTMIHDSVFVYVDLLVLVVKAKVESSDFFGL